MRRIMIMVTALLFLAAVALAGAGLALPSQHAAASMTACPYGDTCVTGKLVVRDPGSDTPHQLLILDKNGAPMLWTDFGGTGSGGAPVCVFSLQLQPLACLGGPWGNYGGEPVVTLYANGRGYSLTAGDITWIHAHEWRPR